MKMSLLGGEGKERGGGLEPNRAIWIKKMEKPLFRITVQNNDYLGQTLRNKIVIARRGVGAF